MSTTADTSTTTATAETTATDATSETATGATTDTSSTTNTETATDTTSGATAETDLGDDVGKWKAHSRKHEQRAKDNAEKAAKADELGAKVVGLEAQLSAATKRAEDAEKALADLEAKGQAATLITDVAAAKGVDASLLRGSTKEELEAHADALLAAGITGKKPAVPSAEGQGKTGVPVGGGDMTATQIVNKALGR